MITSGQLRCCGVDCDNFIPFALGIGAGGGEEQLLTPPSLVQIRFCYNYEDTHHTKVGQKTFIHAKFNSVTTLKKTSYCGFWSTRTLLYFPLSVLRPPFVHQRPDISTFLDILTVYTMKTIYFLNAYHLGW